MGTPQTVILLVWYLADSFLQEFGPFHLGFQICEHRVVHNISFFLFSFFFLDVPGICADVPSSGVSNLCLLSFFLSYPG